MRGDAGALQASRDAVLTEAAEIYEFYTIALYSLDGQLVQGSAGAPERKDCMAAAMMAQHTITSARMFRMVFVKIRPFTQGCRRRSHNKTQ